MLGKTLASVRYALPLVFNMYGSASSFFRRNTPNRGTSRRLDHARICSNCFLHRFPWQSSESGPFPCVFPSASIISTTIQLDPLWFTTIPVSCVGRKWNWTSASSSRIGASATLRSHVYAPRAPKASVEGLEGDKDERTC